MSANNIYEVTLQFPYLTEQNKNGIILSGSSRSKLDMILNNKSYPISVTLYPCKAEHDYAINSAARYTSVDPQFVVGTVNEFNLSNGKIFVRVNDKDNASLVEKGLVLPRMTAKKINEGGIEKLEVVNLISIDILQQ